MGPGKRGLGSSEGWGGGGGAVGSDHLVELFASPTKVSNAEPAFHCKAADVALDKGLKQFIIHGPDQIC